MKKIFSILCSLVIAINTIIYTCPVFAFQNNSILKTANEISEIYNSNDNNKKPFEDMTKARVIVKSNRIPDIYGNAEFIKGISNTYILQYNNITSAQKALDYYKSLDYVEWAETDGILYGQSLSYGNDMMGSDEAKKYITNSNLSTSEVKVAVIDTGIYLSGDMYKKYQDRIIDSKCNFSDSGDKNTARADNPHGSKIASILLDNTGDNVKLVAYKALNKYANASNLSISLTIEQAIIDKVNIISLSLSGNDMSELLKDSIDKAIKNNIVVVCSAGNSSDDVSKYYPAAYDGVITVGAIDKNGNRAFYSNFGDGIDFVAPGHYVETQAKNTISKECGTSFSVAFIDAAAATVLSMSFNLTPNEVKQKLIDSCVSMDELAYHDGFHAIEEYDFSDSNAPKRAFLESDSPDESLYYGYGMPQILSALNLTEQNNKVNFSANSGTYNNEFELTLTSNENSQIYYTTDESFPSKANGTLYESPISIDHTTSIRAISISDDNAKSIPIAKEYKMEFIASQDDFKIDDNGMITEYTGSLLEFVVPDEINNIQVNGISESAFTDEVVGIKLPSTATTLEEYSLSNCKNLKYFTGEGITYVGDTALSCENLVVCDIPNVTYIEHSGLATSKLREINFVKLKYAGDTAFYGMPSLSNVNLPNLKAVEPLSFAYCEVLRNINISSAEYIDYAAFSHCYRLKNIHATNVKATKSDNSNDSVFSICINLVEVNNDNFSDLETVGVATFSNCTKLQRVQLSKAKEVKDSAFTSTSVEKVDLPNVELIGAQSFSNTPYLKELTLPKVKKIADGAFRNSGLEKIITPNLEEIGSYCFSAYNEMYCEYGVSNSLKSIYAPKLKNINDYAFAYLGELTQLDIPHVVNIDDSVFYESSVNYLYVPNLVTAKSLPTADDSLVVVSDSFQNCTYNATNKSLTIQGKKGKYCEEYANKYNLEFIDVNSKGGSIRVTDAGLRFGFSFYDTLGKEVEEYGFIYAKGTANRDSLTYPNIDNKKVLSLIANNQLNQKDKTTTFNLVFTSVPKSAYDMEITARAYVKVDGMYFYSDPLTRSFNQVGNAVLEDEEIDQNTKDKLNDLLTEV